MSPATWRSCCRKWSTSSRRVARSRKPAPAFTDLVASAAAVIFTIPKPDTVKGTTRCLGRMGIFRGDDVKLRYRRLDLRCTRSKTSATITISRGKDE